jgi:hypothetical protein
MFKRFSQAGLIVVIRQRVEVLVEAVKLFHRLLNGRATAPSFLLWLATPLASICKIGLFSRKAFTIKL